MIIFFNVLLYSTWNHIKYTVWYTYVFPHKIVITKTEEGTPVVEETIEDVVEPIEIGNLITIICYILPTWIELWIMPLGYSRH